MNFSRFFHLQNFHTSLLRLLRRRNFSTFLDSFTYKTFNFFGRTRHKVIWLFQTRNSKTSPIINFSGEPTQNIFKTSQMNTAQSYLIISLTKLSNFSDDETFRTNPAQVIRPFHSRKVSTFELRRRILECQFHLQTAKLPWRTRNKVNLIGSRANFSDECETKLI